METIEIKTLVDITNTKVIRPNQGTQLELDQNRNFITLTQCAEIRSIISYMLPPSVETVEIKDLGFGSKYKGKQKVWTFTFQPDREDVYLDENNHIGHLIKDLNGVPCIKNLSETINIDKAIFDLEDGPTKNTIVTAVKSTV